MDLDEWRFVFVSICIVLILAACSPFVLALLPSRTEKFFVLAVLGDEGMAERYYPGDDPHIDVGEAVNWRIYLHNQMGNPQYIALRIKLINSTNLSPNSTTCNPSFAPVGYEIRQVLLNNETRLFPFSWYISNAEKVDNYVNVKSLSVNGYTIDTHAIALSGYNFRFIIELWVYSEESSDFQFNWGSGYNVHCAWNQIWFNVTSPI